MNATITKQAQDFGLNDESVVPLMPEEQRAQDLAVMQAHPLMKNSGMLDDAALAEWLGGTLIQGEADYFDGFSILFGVDRHGQSFVLVRSDTGSGLHFALTAKGGK